MSKSCENMSQQIKALFTIAFYILYFAIFLVRNRLIIK